MTWQDIIMYSMMNPILRQGFVNGGFPSPSPQLWQNTLPSGIYGGALGQQQGIPTPNLPFSPPGAPVPVSQSSFGGAGASPTPQIGALPGGASTGPGAPPTGGPGAVGGGGTNPLGGPSIGGMASMATSMPSTGNLPMLGGARA